MEIFETGEAKRVRGDRRGLTEEQEELRLDGLRVLARVIVRAYLASLADDTAGARDDTAARTPPVRRPLGKDGGHVR